MVSRKKRSRKGREGKSSAELTLPAYLELGCEEGVTGPVGGIMPCV
jgi:hypothetical protein